MKCILPCGMRRLLNGEPISLGLNKQNKPEKPKKPDKPKK
jgi:hypothetical protein